MKVVAIIIDLVMILGSVSLIFSDTADVEYLENTEIEDLDFEEIEDVKAEYNEAIRNTLFAMLIFGLNILAILVG